MENLQNTSSNYSRASHAPGRPRLADSWDADALEKAARKYFEKCDSRTKPTVTKDGVFQVASPAPYTIEGLCCFLRISVNTFKSWLKLNTDLGAAAVLVHQQIIADRVEGALDGRQHAGFAQFTLKNNSPEHYRDKVEVENTVAEEARSMFDQWATMWKELH